MGYIILLKFRLLHNLYWYNRLPNTDNRLMEVSTGSTNVYRLPITDRRPTITTKNLISKARKKLAFSYNDFWWLLKIRFFEAIKILKPQNTSVFEDLKIEKQR